LQFGSGKPVFPAFLWSVLIAVAITLSVQAFHTLNCPKLMSLFFGLFGTVLLASAFSPNSQVPLQGDVWEWIRWFFKPQGATPLNYNRPAYHVALISLAISFVVGALSK
jgi:hypothetical protein